MKINRYILCFLVTALIIGATGCARDTKTYEKNVESNNTKTEMENIELDGAKSVNINVMMGAGELDIQSGSNQLMEGKFIYDEQEWKAPTIEYSRTGEDGRLNLEQSSKKNFLGVGNGRNLWKLNLNKSISTDISVFLGAGNGNLRLNGMNLEKVQVEMGAGKLDMDLSGDWKNDVSVNIEGGVGNANIILPKNIAVVVKVTNAIGNISADGFSLSGDSYVNDAYGKSDITMHVEIKNGIGVTKLILSE